jgi:hypothetical protein
MVLPSELNEIRHVRRGGALTKVMKDHRRKVDKNTLGEIYEEPDYSVAPGFTSAPDAAGMYGGLWPTYAHRRFLSNTESPTPNYGSKIVLDVESTQTSFMQLNLASIHSSYTSADVTKATLKLSANSGMGGVTSEVFEPKGDSGLLAPTGLSRQA